MSDPMLQPHVVLDIETYSLQKNALVLSIGAALFNWGSLYEFEQYRDTGLHVKLDPSAQTKRHVDLETVRWWEEQSESARLASIGDNPVGMAPKYAIRALGAWATLKGVNENSNWYCRGPHFDVAILEDLAVDYGLKLPWDFRQVRDSRTFFDHFERERLDRPDEMIPHHPLDDSAWEAYQMVYWSFQ